MAESVKRRVAAARLAVAFVAAGTIAGTTAWASASPPPPTAQSSAKGQHIKKAALTVRSSDQVADGSLLFQDFKKGEVPSFDQFKHFEKVVFHKYYPKTEIDKSFIKGESSDYVKHSDLDGYVKLDQADSRYIKRSENVVFGDGSVFTASKLVPAVQKVNLLDVPNMFTVDSTGPTVTITNVSGGDMTHSSCDGPPGGGAVSGGTLKQGESMTCGVNGDGVSTVQLISGGSGGSPQVSTLNFSSLQVSGGVQSTVQILIGL